MSLFSRELQLALSGELLATMEALDEAQLRAARWAVDEVTTRTKERLRGMVTGAGLGVKLANAVRGDVYPKRGLARDPAGWIYVQPSATHIFEGFETGATIRSGDGGYIAIPVPGSPAARENQPAGRNPPRAAGGVLAKLKARGLQISFVPARAGRPAMLVAEGARLRTGATGRETVSTPKRLKSGAYAANTASIPLFWLVPEAKMPKRLDFRREFDRAASAFLAEFSAAFARNLASIGRGAALNTGRR